MRVGKCIICGKQFMYDKGRKYTCSEPCKAERNRRDNLVYIREKRAENKPKPKKVKSDLNKDLKKARELGMSYGKYKAYMSGGLAIEK